MDWESLDSFWGWYSFQIPCDPHNIMEKLDKTFCPTYYIGWARTNSAIQTKSEEAASVNIEKCHEKEMAE